MSVVIIEDRYSCAFSRFRCIFEDRVNTFHCPSCGKVNCLVCKAIHENMNCKQYQDDIKLKAKNDKEAQQTQRHIEVINCW